MNTITVSSRVDPDGILRMVVPLSANDANRDVQVTIAPVNPSPTPGESNSSELQTRFDSLVAEWKAARGHIASINKWVQLPAYRQIISLGPQAIPLLLRELARAPDHWFWALKELTGANPVTPESRSNVTEMAKCWIQWGKEHGYVSEGR